MSNYIFSSFLFILGILLIWCHFSIDNVLDPTCDDYKKVNKANKGLLVIGLLFSSLSFSYSLCHYTCKLMPPSSGLGTNMYAGFILFLSITLVTLSGIINSSKKTCLKGTTKGINYALGVSITMLVLSILYVAYKVFMMVNPEARVASSVLKI
jgi:hypothetical protein